MAVFPKTETKIMAVVRNLIGGLKASPNDAMRLTQPLEDFESQVAEFNQINSQIVQREAELKGLYQEKKLLLRQITQIAKGNLRLLQIIYRHQTAELARFGWGERHKRTTAKIPGQPRVLEIAAEGDGWLILDWKPSKDGGKVRFYEIHRRLEGEEDWKMVESSLKTECRLKNQPIKTVMEFCVIAKNNAGASLSSNTVRVVL